MMTETMILMAVVRIASQQVGGTVNDVISEARSMTKTMNAVNEHVTEMIRRNREMRRRSVSEDLGRQDNTVAKTRIASLDPKETRIEREGG